MIIKVILLLFHKRYVSLQADLNVQIHMQTHSAKQLQKQTPLASVEKSLNEDSLPQAHHLSSTSPSEAKPSFHSSRPCCGPSQVKEGCLAAHKATTPALHSTTHLCTPRLQGRGPCPVLSAVCHLLQSSQAGDTTLAETKQGKMGCIPFTLETNNNL